MDEIDIIARMNDGEEDVLTEIFDQFITSYKAVVRSNQLYFEDQTVEDNFIDAIIDLYQNVRSGKYMKKNNASLLTYLYTIGMNRLKNQLTKIKGREEKADLVKDKSNTWMTQPNSDVSIITKLSYEKMIDLMKELSPVHQQILNLYYFDGQSMEKIKDKMGYESARVATVTKSRALKKLKELMNRKYDRDDFL